LGRHPSDRSLKLPSRTSGNVADSGDDELLTPPPRAASDGASGGEETALAFGGLPTLLVGLGTRVGGDSDLSVDDASEPVLGLLRPKHDDIIALAAGR
jgi:hypothetical protein